MSEPDQKNRAERRAEERDKARQAQIERDTETIIKTTPSPVTAVDGLGVERIVTTVDGTYEAPQTDPDPKEVERLANLSKKLDEKKQERLDSMSATSEGGEVARKAFEAEQGQPKAGQGTEPDAAPATPSKGASDDDAKTSDAPKGSSGKKLP